MDPGIEKMMEYAKMERLSARLPPVEDVLKALQSFFQDKTTNKRPIEDSQAHLAVQSLRYVLGHEKKRTAEEPIISNAMLKMAARTGHYLPKETSPAHTELARLVYEELSARRDPGTAPNTTVEHAFASYVKVMCATGFSEQARELLIGKPAHRKTWAYVVFGFLQENNEAEMLRTLQMADDAGFKSDGASEAGIAMFYAKRNNFAAATQWWQEYSETIGRDVGRYDANLVGSILRCCLQAKQIEFGQSLVREFMQSSPPKRLWDVVFVWAAGTGKGVDEIDRMISVMEDSNQSLPEAEWRIPDVATINALVEYAISKNDPYMAERFIALGQARNIEPDAKTFVLQMDYRLSVDDIDGALIAYKHLQALDLSSKEDVPVVNRLIVAMCTTRRHDFDSIMNVAADLSDRQARFDPATVSTLCVLHLSRDELHDVIDLLNTHAFHYSSSERASIRDTLLTYMLDPKTTTTRAWDCYTIWRQVFDEVNREQRTAVMADFFLRKRADMAVHVFNHMRAHTRADTIPTIDTYVAAFMGAAKLEDLESLEVVHNQMKLDYNINISTYLLNALILAYTACDMPRRALDFWQDIVKSREGPTYNSLHIAFRACEKAPFGDLQAQEIWDLLRRRGVERDQRLWASYVSGLAGNGDIANVIQIIEKAEQENEVDVDSYLLGSFFNAIPGQSKQEDVAIWIKERYPEIWTELGKIGVNVREDDMRFWKIDRDVGP